MSNTCCTPPAINNILVDISYRILTYFCLFQVCCSTGQVPMWRPSCFVGQSRYLGRWCFLSSTSCSANSEREWKSAILLKHSLRNHCDRCTCICGRGVWAGHIFGAYAHVTMLNRNTCRAGKGKKADAHARVLLHSPAKVN